MTATLGAVLLSSASLMAEPGSVVVKKVLETTETASGRPITVPPHPELTVSTYTIPAHESLAMHKHPYARYAYVLEGRITVETLTGERFDYETGDVIVEVIDQWHLGRTGDGPARLLVIDQTPPGASATILKDKSATE